MKGSSRLCWHSAATAAVVAGFAAWMATAGLWAAGRDDWQQPDRVMQELQLRPGQVVADVGCGRGYFVFRLAEAVGEDGKVFGVDIDQAALAHLQQQAEQRGVANIEVIQSEPTDTKLEPESLDAALLCLVLHHVPEEHRQGLLQSIARALRPGARLFVLDLRKVENPPFHTYEQLVAREEVIEKAAAVGLKLDAEYYYLRYQYFLRFVCQKPGQTMIFDFERYATDEVPQGWECRGSNGYASTLSIAQEQREAGPTRVLRMDYNFDAELAQGYAADTRKSCIAGTWEQLPEVPRKLRVDVKGDSSGNNLVISVGEPTAEWFDYEVGPIDWTGWRTVEVGIDERWRGNGGDGANGVIEPPLLLASLNVEQLGPARGTICFDNILCVHEPPGE